MNNPFLSIIVPVFNEKDRVHKIKEIIDFKKNQSFSTEIIIFNDGSYDTTEDMLKKLNKENEFTLLSYGKNRGKGHAIKIGMLASKGDFRLFTDIDLSSPLTELYKLLPYIKEYDVIIGSRKAKSSKITVRQPKLRELMGKGYTRLSQLVLQSSVADFTCGFKCFSSKAANTIFSYAQINGWGFDSEILFLAQKKGFRVKEVAIAWKNDPGTKVRFPQDIIHSLTELMTIRINEIRGKY